MAKTKEVSTMDIITLLLFVCSISRTIASQLSPTTDTFLNAKFCNRTCNCWIDSVHFVDTYRVECPNVNPSIDIRVMHNKHPYIWIDCMTLNETTYTRLPNINIGDISGNIPEVHFAQCPLPMAGSSFMTILNQLGIKKIKQLWFRGYEGYNLGNSLRRHHFRGFTKLEELNWIAYGLSDLPEDVFDDVGSIKSLILRTSKVHLPVNIFRSLKKLKHMELTINLLNILEPGIFKHQQKLKSLDLFWNHWQNLTKEVFEGQSSLLELNLRNNKIEETLQSDVFCYLTNLTKIELHGNRFGKLPLLFEHNKNLVKVEIIACGELNYDEMHTLPNCFLSDIPTLEQVKIECGLDSVPMDLFSGSNQIRKISLAHNKLSTLPKNLFVDQTNLLKLDLSYNSLFQLEDGLFDSMTSLIHLQLAHNELTTISGTLFHGMPIVQEIHLDNNKLTTIHHSAFKNTKQLRDLQLHHNFLTEYEEGIKSVDIEIGSHFQHLKELDLSYNNLSHFSLSDLQFFSNDITINLAHNAIKHLDFTKHRQIIAQNFMRKATIFLNDNPIICDCRLYHFIEYIQNNPRNMLCIEADQLKCSSPELLIGKPVTQLHLIDIMCPMDPRNNFN